MGFGVDPGMSDLENALVINQRTDLGVSIARYTPCRPNTSGITMNWMHVPVATLIAASGNGFDDVSIGGTLVGVLNTADAIVVCADRRLSTGAGTTVTDLDSKIEILGPGAVSFTTGLTVIIGAAERREIFNTAALVSEAVKGANVRELEKVLPVLGRSVGQSFERYLQSRPRNSWPASGTRLLTAGFAWFNGRGEPNIAALTLTNLSNNSINVDVDGQLWGPTELRQLIPLFFGRVEVPRAIANRSEPEWKSLREEPLMAKVLASGTLPKDISVTEAEEYMRKTIRHAADLGPSRLGLPNTVSAVSQCFVLRRGMAVQRKGS